jgi:N-acetylmuramoyl-L-alanine amidase
MSAFHRDKTSAGFKKVFMGSKGLIKALLGIGLLTGTLAPTATAAALPAVSSRGKNYVPLSSMAPYYSMQLSEPAKNRVRLQNRWYTLDFETDSRRCWINGTLVWLNSPNRRISGRWAVEKIDFDKVIDPALRPYSFLTKAGSRIIVLDPGHGGRDNGAVSPRRVVEKLLTLDLAKRVRSRLQARGLTVKLTRESDSALSLTDRCEKAADWNADVFVSFHADSAGKDKSANGAGTFVLSLPGCYSTGSYGQGNPPATVHEANRFDAANTALGYRIQQNLVKNTGQTDRGVKRARFQVLRDAPCPSALVEVAFLSNPKEEAMLIDAAKREQIARGIADGIAAYLYDVERGRKMK